MSTGKRGVILVVDDDATIREAIEMTLEDEGYAVVTAGDGDAALAQLRGGLRPVLALVDQLMPGIEGPALVREIAADPALAAIPLVGMSAATAQRLDAWEGTGVQAVLRKPFSLEALIDTVNRFARRAG